MPQRMIPTHLKVLRGNPGKQKLYPEPEPEVPQYVPDAPDFLVGYACDEWYRVAEELHRLKLLTIIDVRPLAAYCHAFGVWRDAVDTLNRMAANDPQTHGLVIKGNGGKAVQNPMWLTARQAANDMVRYAGEFGLSPAARARISNPTALRATEQSKFAGLLAAG